MVGGLPDQLGNLLRRLADLLGDLAGEGAAGRNLCQYLFERAVWTLPRLPQDGIAEPFGQRLAGPFGRRFDLLQLLNGEPGSG
jgi:hypothetical protein